MSDPLVPPAANPSDPAAPAAPAVPPAVPPAALPAEPVAEPPACENCGAPLQGEYCHACGQSVHNPIRHAGHAIEELFESLWHLDGRVFRTPRDLLVPARVACGYLAGHRARYIAPLRLFVVLSLLTFFIGAVAVHVGDDGSAGSGVCRCTSSRARAPTQPASRAPASTSVGQCTPR